jgi:hypothetical protein
MQLHNVRTAGFDSTFQHMLQTGSRVIGRPPHGIGAMRARGLSVQADSMEHLLHAGTCTKRA